MQRVYSSMDSAWISARDQLSPASYHDPPAVHVPTDEELIAEFLPWRQHVAEEEVPRPPPTPSTESEWSTLSLPINRQSNVRESSVGVEQVPLNDIEMDATHEEDSDWDDALCRSEVDLTTHSESDEEDLPSSFHPRPVQNRSGSPDPGSIWVIGSDGIRRIPTPTTQYPPPSQSAAPVYPEFSEFFDMDLIFATLEAHLPPYRTSQHMRDANDDEWRCVCGCEEDQCFFRTIMRIFAEHVQQSPECADDADHIPTCPVSELISYFKTHLYDDEYGGAESPFLDEQAYSTVDRYDLAAAASRWVQAHPVPTCALIAMQDEDHETYVAHEASRAYRMLAERTGYCSNLHEIDRRAIDRHRETYHRLVKIGYHPLFYKSTRTEDVFSSDADSDADGTMEE